MNKKCLFSLLLSGLSLFSQTPVSTCTVTNIRGVPVAGTFCGGSAVVGSRSCTAGALYACKNGAMGTMNNCTLAQACATGCLQNEDTGRGACFNGPAPFSVSPLNVAGGSDVDLNVSLAAPHSGAIVNLEIDRGDLIPGAFCAVPPLPPNVNTLNFALSTAVVAQFTPVQLFIDLPYNDPSGANGMELISKPQLVTLNPGGVEPPPPPIASFVLDPTSIGAGGIGFARVTLAGKAPASGTQIAMTSSNPAVASIIQAGLPFVTGSCTVASVAESIQGAQSVPQTTVVNIGASSGAPGQAPLSQPLTVTSGCVPVACSGGPSCGPQPDGCGGTMNCGCADANQTCGGGGVANMCGTPVVSVSSLTMSPATVTGGGSSTGTVRLNPPAGFGGTSVALSSNNPAVQVPASVAFPSGANVATFTAATSAVTGNVTATISATLNTTSSATLTVTPAPSCVPTTCTALGKICGTAPDGCGGTLTCGSACGSTSAAITLSVNGKGGKVTSSPAGLNVSSGKSGSASFAIGSSVTLTTDNGHGAIWSVLCSSGGRAAASCAFTVSSAGTVTATEQ